MIYVDQNYPNNRAISAQKLNEAEVTYALADINATNPTPELLFVDLGDMSESLQTGDVVMARITMAIPADRATQLGLTTSANNVIASTGRRLLSEEHESARRMLLDFHNSRRSAQEFRTVRDVVRNLGVPVGRVAKSEATKLLQRPAAEKDLMTIDDQQQATHDIINIYRQAIRLRHVSSS
ncbi:hypothetical protein PLESTM_001155800 [Pleodorina starrii]|nr:hypothetical protein PLESTM_001155800 [Pleodorina starrii]